MTTVPTYPSDRFLKHDPTHQRIPAGHVDVLRIDGEGSANLEATLAAMVVTSASRTVVASALL